MKLYRPKLQSDQSFDVYYKKSCFKIQVDHHWTKKFRRKPTFDRIMLIKKNNTHHQLSYKYQGCDSYKDVKTIIKIAYTYDIITFNLKHDLCSIAYFHNFSSLALNCYYKKIITPFFETTLCCSKWNEYLIKCNLYGKQTIKRQIKILHFFK